MSATIDCSEGVVSVEVKQALRAHPAVSWCERQNTGSASIGGRFVRFGWPGCADVLGELHDGRFLAVECKSLFRPKKLLNPAQGGHQFRFKKVSRSDLM